MASVRLELEAFPAYAPLLSACQDFAELSGCRFQRGSFNDLDNQVATCLQKSDELPPVLAAKVQAASVVTEYSNRLRAGEQELVEQAARAYRLVMTESVRSGILATCRELGLWPPDPTPAGVCADDCAYEDTTASLPVIAQRIFNDEERRGREDVLRPLQRRAVTASFLVDFAVDVDDGTGSLESSSQPQLSESHREMLQEFMARVEEWVTGRPLPGNSAASTMSQAQQALLLGLSRGGAAVDGIRQEVQARWSKNWETPTGTAINLLSVFAGGLALAAGAASLRRTTRGGSRTR